MTNNKNKTSEEFNKATHEFYECFKNDTHEFYEWFTNFKNKPKSNDSGNTKHCWMCRVKNEKTKDWFSKIHSKIGKYLILIMGWNYQSNFKKDIDHYNSYLSDKLIHFNKFLVPEYELQEPLNNTTKFELNSLFVFIYSLLDKITFQSKWIKNNKEINQKWKEFYQNKESKMEIPSKDYWDFMSKNFSPWKFKNKNENDLEEQMHRNINNDIMDLWWIISLSRNMTMHYSYDFWDVNLILCPYTLITLTIWLYFKLINDLVFNIKK